MKRRINKFTLAEISAIDKPAQQSRFAPIIKRDSTKETTSMKTSEVRKGVLKILKDSGYMPGDGWRSEEAEQGVFDAWIQSLRNVPALRQAWVDALSRVTGFDPADIEGSLEHLDQKLTAKSAGGRKQPQTVAEATDEARKVRTLQAQGEDMLKSGDAITKASVLDELDQHVESLRQSHESTADAYSRALGIPGDDYAKSLYNSAKQMRPVMSPGGVSKRRYS
jgi:hypothetical protein